MLSRTITPRRKGRRWLTALATLSLLTGTFVVSNTAVGLSQSQFELDKNATDDLTTFHQGSLKSQINSTSATTFNVCQLLTDPVAGDIILVDAEQMEINSVTLLPGNGSTKTGGCSFSNPDDVALNVKVYDVDRGVNGTTAATHPGAADVTLMVTGAVAGDDWDDVYASVLADGSATTHTCDDVDAEAVACLFIADGGGDSGIAEETVFTQGGSKDDLNINPLVGEPGTGWQWTDSSVPPSDEILDAFAIKYDDGTTQLLFFGADRWSTNGAKDMGFWFFHDTVGRITDPADPNFGRFSGNHTRPTDPDGIPDNGDETRGDILLLSTFTQGGAVTTIRVFEWVGEGGNTNGTLNSIGAFGDCVPGDPADAGCNTVTNTTVPSPWPYQGAGSNDVADVIYTGGLAEGGIDLTALGLEGCFSSFMAETRSSPEAGAQLKDFALGNFESCTTDLTTTPSNGSGTPLVDGADTDTLPEITIGTGAAGVDVTDSALLDVKGSTNFTGHIDFYICGPIDDPTLCDSDGFFVSSETANANGTYTSDPVNLTSVGRYCWRGEFIVDTGDVPGDTDSSVGECFEVDPVTPSLSTQAIAPPLSAPVSGPVDFGDPVYDKAILSGTAYKPGTDGTNATYPTIEATMDTPANGSITFELRGPDDPALDCTTVAAGEPQTSNPETVDVSGDGDYFTTGFTPDSPGDYHWVASYTGDSPNTNGTTHNTGCLDTDEDVTVQQIPTEIKTKQSWYPNDTATISSSVAGDNLEAGGSVVFELWDSATCDGNMVYTETVLLTGGSNSEEVGTDNGTFLITTGYGDAGDSTAGPYSWLVTYTPTGSDTAHTGIQSACDAEHFSTTYTNDAGPGTALPTPTPTPTPAPTPTP